MSRELTATEQTGGGTVDEPSAAAVDYARSRRMGRPTRRSQQGSGTRCGGLDYGSGETDAAVTAWEGNVQAGLDRIAEDEEIVTQMNRLSEGQRARVRRMKVDATSRASSAEARYSRSTRCSLLLSAARHPWGSPHRRNARTQRAKARAPSSRSSDDDPEQLQSMTSSLASAGQFYVPAHACGAVRCWLDVTGISAWSGWTRHRRSQGRTRRLLHK